VQRGAASQFTVSGQPEGTWYYRVRAFGAGTKSPWSAHISTQWSAVVPAWTYLPLVVRDRATGSDSGLPISEGFEGGVVPPSGWTVVQTNPRQTWKIATTNPYEGSYRADCEYDDQLGYQSEVLLSPQFEASSAWLQFYSFGSLYWCRDTHDNCDLRVWLVIGDWGGGDDVHVHTADGDWTSSFQWSSSAVNLTPYLPTGTPARVGFEYVGQDGAQVGLDAISITQP